MPAIPASSEYLAALEAFGVVNRFYSAKADAYRAREIDDAEFLAARKALDEAHAAFDVAEAAERDRIDDVIADGIDAIAHETHAGVAGGFDDAVIA